MSRKVKCKVLLALFFTSVFMAFIYPTQFFQGLLKADDSLVGMAFVLGFFGVIITFVSLLVFLFSKKNNDDKEEEE